LYTPSPVNSTPDLRGFLPPCEAKEPPRSNATQGDDNEAGRQKDRKDGVLFAGDGVSPRPLAPPRYEFLSFNFGIRVKYFAIFVLVRVKVNSFIPE